MLALLEAAVDVVPEESPFTPASLSISFVSPIVLPTYGPRTTANKTQQRGTDGQGKRAIEFRNSKKEKIQRGRKQLGTAEEGEHSQGHIGISNDKQQMP